jgi:hypothetical protein
LKQQYLLDRQRAQAGGNRRCVAASAGGGRETRASAFRQSQRRDREQGTAFEGIVNLRYNRMNSGNFVRGLSLSRDQIMRTDPIPRKKIAGLQFGRS